MPLAITPEWQQLGLYAVGLAVLLVLLLKIPFVGAILRSLLSIALLAFCIFLLLKQAPFDPTLLRVTARLGIDRQEVVGGEVRVHMAADGHFWVRASINGVKVRMLVDSGATITALSEDVARRAIVERSASLLPVLMHTANGTVQAETGEIRLLALGAIEARNLKVVVSPALGNINILGMNFLSQLGSWRVEDRTLILVPKTV